MTSEGRRGVVWCAVGVCGALVAATLRAGPVSSGRSSESPQTVFRTQVDLVRVDVRVERRGAPVVGLTASDFEVRDDGVVQTIVDASLEQIPLDVFLLIDTSASVTDANALTLRDAAWSFIDGLTSRDRAGVLTFSRRATLMQPLTFDLARVRSQIPATSGAGSTALNDALYAGLRHRESKTTRGAIVVFTDGIDNVSWLSGDEVIEAGKRSDTIVYAVVVDIPNPTVRAADNMVLGTLAAESGGRVWKTEWGTGPVAAFRAVLADLRSRYVLSYYPSGVATAGWHRLDVKVRRGAGKVTARAGYTRTSPADSRPARTP